jgi:hypothetical protein
LGPHIAFQGGASAVAYAAKAGKVENGQDIGAALWGLDAPDVLLVGGLFGLLGYVFTSLLNLISPINGFGWTDTIALSIFFNATITRFLFGSTGWLGDVGGKNRWAPTQKPLSFILIAFALGGIFSSFAVANPGFHPLGFGLTAFWLIFLRFGASFPVAHHIAHPAMIAAVYSGSLWWGVAFAILGAFLGDISGMLFNYFGDTHIDPPAVTIFILTTLAAILAPVMENTGDLVGGIVAAVIAIAGYGLFTAFAGGGEAVADAA